MNSSKKKFIGIGIFVAFVVAITLIWWNFREKPIVGNKAISIEVINKDAESTLYEIETDAEFLRQAMEEAGVEFSGNEGDYGLMIDTVNGEKADYAIDGAYWGFYVNGTYCNYGIDKQPVKDGDEFQIIYSK